MPMFFMFLLGILAAAVGIVGMNYFTDKGKVCSFFCLGVIGIAIVLVTALIGIDATASEVYNVEELYVEENDYVVISDEGKVCFIPKVKAAFVISDTERVIVETNNAKVVKAMFYLTKERMIELVEIE